MVDFPSDFTRETRQFLSLPLCSPVYQAASRKGSTLKGAESFLLE